MDILFVLMQVKLGTVLPIHRCALGFRFNLKIFSCLHASTTLVMKLLTLISSIKI